MFQIFTKYQHLLESLVLLELENSKSFEKSYYEALKEKSRLELDAEIPLFRSQLMFMGNIGVGKTSLITLLKKKWKKVKVPHRPDIDIKLNFLSYEEGIITELVKFSTEKPGRKSRRLSEGISKRKQGVFIKLWDFGSYSVSSFYLSNFSTPLSIFF